MYIFEKPVRKVGYYVVPIKTKRTIGAEINIRSCRVDMCEPLPKGKGYLMSFYIPRNTTGWDAVTQLDNAALDAVIANNREWFKNKNELTGNEIAEFWRPSMSQQNSLIVNVANADVDVGLLGQDVSVVLTAPAITIKPQGFRIAWRVKAISVITWDDADAEDVDVNKVELDASWAAATALVVKDADAKIKELEAKIADLEGFKAEVGGLLRDALAESDVTETWNVRLGALEGRIADFRSGALGAR